MPAGDGEGIDQVLDAALVRVRAPVLDRVVVHVVRRLGVLRRRGRPRVLALLLRHFCPGLFGRARCTGAHDADDAGRGGGGASFESVEHGFEAGEAGVDVGAGSDGRGWIGIGGDGRVCGWIGKCICAVSCGCLDS